MSLDSIFEHIKIKHGEKIRTEKQIASVEKRRREREEAKSLENDFISAIKGTN